MKVARRTLASGLMFLLAACSLRDGQQASASRIWRAESHALRPLAFEENRGQMDDNVRFLSRGAGYGLFLTLEGAVLALQDGTAGEVLRLRWIGANPKPHISGERELPGRSNYLIGRDPAAWRTGIRSYAQVRYAEVYPGIDLVFYGRQRQLEHDFVVAPGADPQRVRLALLGTDHLEIDPEGDLVVGCGRKEVRLRRPVSYQEIGGVRREVASAWRMLPEDGPNRIGFRLGAYDASRPLVIDPVLVYSTYLGGSADDHGNSIAVDAGGNAYVTGLTRSPDFPRLGSPPPSPYPFDAFVTKFSASGALVYSTYLGGQTSIEEGYGIAVDSAGHAFVTGLTDSWDFPLVNPLPAQFRGGGGEVFISELSPDGASLMFSTTLGGISDTEQGNGIAVDAGGNMVVVGTTYSPDFPSFNALYPASSGGFPDAFVVKLSPSGSLLFSTFLGGTSGDEATGVAVNSSGYIYITGATESQDFPVRRALRSSLSGESDGFVVRLLPSGRSLDWSTYLGGSSSDGISAVALDGSGNAYLTGATESPDFPLVNPLQSVLRGESDVFVTKLSAQGSILYSTYLGGSMRDEGLGIRVNLSASAYVTGLTYSADFPLKVPVQSSCEPQQGTSCSENAFVTKLTTSGSGILYSTYLGGSGSQAIDRALGIAIDSRGDAYVTGWTSATDFPTANAMQPSLAGGVDAFVTRISPQP